MNLIRKWEQFENFAKHKILNTVCSLILIASVSVTMIGFVVPKDVVIVDGGNETKVTTSRVHVEELLAEQKINLRVGDRISQPLDSVLRDGDVISIERGKTIHLTVDGVTKTIYSCEDVLGKAIAESGIVVNELDEMIPAAETAVTEGMKASLVRVCVKEETYTETIEPTTVIKPKYDAKANHSVVMSEGKAGSQEVTYKITTRDGVETNREVVRKTILAESVDRVVEKGIQGAKVVAASASELKVKQVIDCSATAYTAYNGARTASGKVAAYGIVAVDPRVIPMGSKLYIEAQDGSWVYGYAIAGDTGGAIKGKKVDLFYNSNSECIYFGRRPARVYVLE